MRTSFSRTLLSLGLTLGLVLGSTAVQLSNAAADVTCKDGTTSSTTGRGACSHHGGVAKAATSAPAAAAPASGGAVGNGAPAADTTAGMVACKDGSQSKAGRGACSHHGGMASAGAASAPAPVNDRAPSGSGAAAPSGAGSSGGKHADATGATAKCKDGTFSHSAHHSGSCSHHGGVAEWLDGSGK